MDVSAVATSAEGTGLTLGRYELLFRFAAGGMAEVYAARARGAEGFERLVAVKRMLPTLSDDPKFVEMFLDEAKVAANVHSRHVVSTLDLGRASDGSLYIVMDLIRGLSLNRLVKRALAAGERLPVDVVSEILTQTAIGLHDAHEAVSPDGTPLQIVHRDVSPQNVLLDRSGAVRLTDFGVARAVERHSRTETGELRGKVAYFAPEQMSGGAIDRRTDIFALGVVAHEMVTGERLFRAENAWLTLQQVASAEIPRVDARRPDVPAALADAIDLALNRDPDGRYATAAEFAEAVRRAVPPAGGAPLGALVTRFGGPYLDTLDAKLRAASQRPAGSPIPPAGGPDSTPDATEVSGPRPLSTTAEVPDVLPPPAPSKRAPRRSSLAWMIVLPCVAAAAGAFLMLRARDAESTAPPVDAPPLTSTAQTTPEPAVTDPSTPEPPAPDPSTPEPSEPAALAPNTAEMAEEPEPAPTPRRRPPRARPSREPMVERPVPPETVEPTGAPAAPDPRPAQAPGSSVLMGADAFERELGGR